MNPSSYSLQYKPQNRLVSVVDVDIAPMNPYQPLPFYILSYANITVQDFN